MIKNIGDKAKHFLVGFIAGAFGRMMCSAVWGWEPTHGTGFGFGLVLGLGKEAYDEASNAMAERRGEKAPHTVEIGDVISTALGGAAGEAVVAAVRFFVRGT